jgi:AAA+ ATPase superfamily predicted ATPase
LAEILENERTMKHYPIEIKRNFIGREPEVHRLENIAAQPGAKIIIVYGRRRVGKTELLEQTFRKRNLLKFEGQENLAQALQMQFVMQQLADYAQEPLLSKIKATDWVEVLKYISERTASGQWTLYFEEVQWLANYETQFISALKYVWDNFFRHNPELIIILCGSSPSFMINEVIKSKALYNRSQYELPLREFNLIETRAMLKKYSLREVLDAYLTVGGIPEYLLRLQNKSSIYVNLCHESFLSGAFFTREYEKIFTSSLGNNKNYKKIVDFLSKKKYATREDISKNLKLKSGGGLTDFLQDLEVCGFIQKYTPFNLASNSLLARYCITDAYLQFYFKFIHPLEKYINNGDYDLNPLQAINMATYQKWLGFSFERFCRKYHRVFAKILGFSGVKYQVGTFFSRKTNADSPGFQIDLIFDREDHVVTLCEIKYTQTNISSKVIDEFDKKLELFPNEKNKTIQRVLITNTNADKALLNRAYFDYIITLENIFDAANWR